MEENIYKQHGYNDRNDYLKSLAEDYGISFAEVKTIANMLGENEDFDALITSLDEYSDDYYYNE